MGMTTLVFLMLALLGRHGSSGSILYVKADATPSKDCPGKPCATLEEYIKDSLTYFTTGSVFLFLPGNHDLQVSLSLSNVSNIELDGTGSNTSATIVCTEEVVVYNVTSLVIKGLKFVVSFHEHENFTVLVFTSSKYIVINNTVFFNNASSGRALSSISSNLTIFYSHFENNTAVNGGSIIATQSTNLIIIGSTLIRNKATNIGGALYAHNSTVILMGNDLLSNAGYAGGGSISCHSCTIIMTDCNNFNNSIVKGESDKDGGGAIGVIGGNITIKGQGMFSNNEAAKGGAISLINTTAQFTEANITFIKNKARLMGGGIYCLDSTLTSSNEITSFIENKAEGCLDFVEPCGAICLYNTSKPASTLTPKLVNNSGALGGALFIERGNGFTFTSIYARYNSDGVIGIYNAQIKTKGNNIYINNEGQGAITINLGQANFTESNKFEENFSEGGAITVSNSSVVLFFDTVVISNNTGVSGGGAITITQSKVTFLQTDSTVISGNKGHVSGGAISAVKSYLSFSGQTLLSSNSGYSGGAISTILGTLMMATTVKFVSNVAAALGGAVHASGTNIHLLLSEIMFLNNSARDGGAIYLELGANIILDHNVDVTLEENRATGYGGAIYHKDSVSDLQCKNIAEIYNNTLQVSALPTAFFQISSGVSEPYYCPCIISTNNSAGIDGNFLYGGLLDRSRMDFYPDTPYTFFTSFCPFKLSQNKSIASDPYQVKPCSGNKINTDNTHINISVYRGQTFCFSVVAIGQGRNKVPTTLRAATNSTAILKLNQNSQYISRSCSKVEFNLFSTLNESNSQETLTLYANGPCQTIGESKMSVYVNLLPCPNAFVQSGDKCVCEESIRKYNVNCTIVDKVYIIRLAGSKFWMNATYNKDGSYEGLILYPSCPIQYCRRDRIDVSLGNPDAQCNFNRSGMLCGRCAANYSLMLGGSQCGECPNLYLILLVLFAFAGIALTIFLMVLRFTVSTGTLNSFILYANLVQVNREIFFISGRTNLFTVFVAWMNLDLGFSTCFFDGMDAYSQTWLQYTFSFYVWCLMTLIIIASRYSLTVSKIVGSNPIAVLATLLLMSYNKILKVIIDVFSSVSLEYPGGKRVTVWMKDANVPYFHSKHFILSTFTIFMLVFIFLPYTAFLLLGQWLYRLSHKHYYSWLLMRMKPLLDSYHAPYKIKTRYWTGFLLLIRCALYAVFSLNSLGSIQYSLLAIIISFSLVGGLSWLYQGIYEWLYIDAVEASIYLNLIILSAAAATLPESHRELATDVLVGIVLVTFMGMIGYQIHVNYFADSSLYIKIGSMIKRPVAVDVDARSIFNKEVNEEKPRPKTLVSPMRETLLEY